MQLKAGTWPENDKLAIERLSSQFFGIDLGDEVIFEFEANLNYQYNLGAVLIWLVIIMIIGTIDNVRDV